MGNLSHTTTYVKRRNSLQPASPKSTLISSTYHGKDLYDPFHVNLSPRGWLRYSLEVFCFVEQKPYPTQPVIADMLGVSERTVRRADREIMEKRCSPVYPDDLSCVLDPEDAKLLYSRSVYCIPTLYCIHRYNKLGRQTIVQSTLAATVGCSIDSICRAIQTLDLHRFIRRRRNFDNTGRQKSDELRLLVAKKSVRQKQSVRQNVASVKAVPQVMPDTTADDTGHHSGPILYSTRLDKECGVYDKGSHTGTSPDSSFTGRERKFKQPVSDPSIIKPDPSHEQLIDDCDLLDHVLSISPGSSRLDHLRRPGDRDLFIKIREDEFVDLIMNDPDYREEHRDWFWANVFRSQSKKDMRRYREGEVLCRVKNPATGKYIRVTPELDKLAKQFHSLYKNLLRSRHRGGMWMRLGKMNEKSYEHFIRTAHCVVGNRAVRYARLWFVCQFDFFEELQRDGVMKKRIYPQPNYFYGEKAEMRFAGYMATRIENAQNTICTDEIMVSNLMKFADIQERLALKKDKRVSPKEFLLSDDAKVLLRSDHLYRFFQLQAPTEA